MITIERINPFKQADSVSAIVQAYQKTFGQAPWNEGYKCPVCEETVSLIKKTDYCPSCLKQGKSVIMVEYWPKNKVITDFYQEMSKPESLCLIAKFGDDVVGFAWGYEVFINHTIDEYLEAPGLHELVSGDFFYLDEVAVLPEFQGKGIGRNLIKQLFENQPHKKIILRTLEKSQMSNLINSMEGKIILPISRDRVIMSLVL